MFLNSSKTAYTSAFGEFLLKIWHVFRGNMNTFELQPDAQTGVILRPPQPTDFIAGAETGIPLTPRIDSGDWKNYLPTDEGQSSIFFDTFACVTFSALNCLESQMNFLMKSGTIPPDVLAELRAMGFFDENDLFNASDRFTAKMSGTTHQGNYLTTVWDSIRNHGILPEKDWAYPREQRSPAFVWEDYYAEIPQELKDKAKRFTELFETQYHWLGSGEEAKQVDLKEWLKMAPVQIATAVCSPWNTTDVIQGCAMGTGHATMLYSASNLWFDIEDHYKPYQKRLALDYPIHSVLQGVVSLVKPKPMPIDPAFGKSHTGQLLLAVEDHGAIWYVTPDGKRAKIGRTPEEVTAFLQAINDKRIPILGINNADLNKIATI